MATSPLQDGAEIERRRIEAGLTKTGLAQKAGVHQTYIYLLESGKRSAQPPVIAALAKALKCRTRDLLKNAA